MITEIILCITAVLLIVSLYYCFKFAMVILRVQDVLEESLDILDERYGSITEILDRPLFYDSPEVRKVLEDIRVTRNAVHTIARSLVDNFDERDQNEG
tara:strand:- start:339 stop:632 length:294 start_codon:yes stop_codon:yes gene_type:complete